MHTPTVKSFWDLSNALRFQSLVHIVDAGGFRYTNAQVQAIVNGDSSGRGFIVTISFVRAAKINVKKIKVWVAE